jgi:hypothetical protein
MDKYQKLAKKLNISKEKEITIPVYSEDLFAKLNIGEQDDFYTLTSVEDIAYNYFTNLKDTTLNQIKFGVIDDEYLTYLKKLNIQDSISERQNYINSLSNKKLLSLWEKNDYNYGYDYGILPIILVPEQDIEENASYNFKLSGNVVQKIKNSIFKTLSVVNKDNTEYKVLKENIAVSPYIIKLSDYEDDNILNKVFDYCVDVIDNNEPQEINNFKTQVEELDFFGIFIVYRYNVPFVITRDFIEASQKNVTPAFNFEYDYLSTLLKDNVSIDFNILTENLIYKETIEQVIKDVLTLSTKYFLEQLDTVDEKVKNMSMHCKVKDKNKNKKKK